MKRRWKKMIALCLTFLLTVSTAVFPVLASDFESPDVESVFAEALTDPVSDASVSVDEQTDPAAPSEVFPEERLSDTLTEEENDNKLSQEDSCIPSAQEETSRVLSSDETTEIPEEEIPEMAGYEDASEEENSVNPDFEAVLMEGLQNSRAKDGEEFHISGKCGDNLSFRIELLEKNVLEWYDEENGESGKDPSAKLTISGTGAMYDFPEDDFEAQPWYKERWNVTEIVMEPGITHIGNWSFCWFDNLKEVTIPDTVTSIGAFAFAWDHKGTGRDDEWVPADSIRQITIPSSVKSLGENAFCGNEFLSEIRYEGDLASICPRQTDEEGNEIRPKDKLESAFRNTMWYEEQYGDRPLEPDKQVTLSYDHNGHYEFTVNQAGYYRITIDNPDLIPMDSYVGFDDEDHMWHHLCDRGSTYWDEEAQQDRSLASFSYSVSLNAGQIYHTGVNIWEEGDEGRVTLHMEYKGTTLGGNLTEAISWEVTDHVLTVTGTGEIPDNSRLEEWDENVEEIQKIRIEDGITYIGANTFRDLNHVTAVEIAASVKAAGREAFGWLERLENVTYHGDKLVDITPEKGDDGYEMCYYDRLWSVFPGDWMEKNYKTELRFNQAQPLSYEKWAQTYQKAPNGAGYYRVTIKNPGKINFSTWIGYHDEEARERGEDDWHHINGRDARGWDEESQQDIILPEFSYVLYLEDSITYEFNARVEEYGYNTDSMTFGLEYLGNTIKDTYASGRLTWTVDKDGLLSVSGTGEIPDGDAPWRDYNSSIKAVALSEGITRIGSGSMQDLYLFGEEGSDASREIVIPSTVTEISRYAFWNTPVPVFVILNANTALKQESLGYRWDDEAQRETPYDLIIAGHSGSTAVGYAGLEDSFIFKTLLADTTVILATSTCYYDGKAKTPEVTVTLGTQKLTKDKDYTVSYQNNTKAGIATVIISGINGYYGAQEKTFKILPANKITASNTAKTVAYSTKSVTYKLNTKVQGGAKVTYKTSSKYVTVSSKGVITIKAKAPVGLYTITITAAQVKNKYAKAAKKATLTIQPAKPVISSVQNVKGLKATVKWKKAAEAGGYEIQYAAKSNFSDAKTVKIKKNSTVSTTISKLKKGKTYYIRIHSYKTVSKNTYYSAWSAVKKIKVKK